MDKPLELQVAIKRKDGGLFMARLTNIGNGLVCHTALGAYTLDPESVRQACIGILAFVDITKKPERR